MGALVVKNMCNYPNQPQRNHPTHCDGMALHGQPDRIAVRHHVRKADQQGVLQQDKQEEKGVGDKG